MRRQRKGKIARIKKELDIQASLFTRNRDKVCQRCGSNKTLQCAHIFTRTNLSTRWNPSNLLTLCYPCHIHWSHRKPMEFAEWIEHKLGAAKLKKLRKETKEIYPETNLKLESEIKRIKSLIT